MATTKTAARAARTRKSPAADRRSAALRSRAREAGGRTAVVRGAAAAAAEQPGGPPPDLTLNRAREELGLDFGVLELAVETGEIAVVRDGTGRVRVPAAEVERVRQAAGGPEALAERIQLVNTTAGAELLGISRDRLLRLTRAGRLWPARWYVNRYRAVVWLYLAGELRDFATGNPALLAGRLPEALRAEVAEGPDLRPRCWRIRQVAHLVREAQDSWEEAAIWAALLGPEVVADAVPDPYERSRLRTIHPELPHGRPGVLADAALVRRMTTADAPDEIATALLALSDALARARRTAPLALPPPTPAAAAGAASAPARPVRGRGAVPEAVSEGDPPSGPGAEPARPAKSGPLRGKGAVAGPVSGGDSPSGSRVEPGLPAKSGPLRGKGAVAGPVSGGDSPSGLRAEAARPAIAEPVRGRGTVSEVVSEAEPPSGPRAEPARPVRVPRPRARPGRPPAAQTGAAALHAVPGGVRPPGGAGRAAAARPPGAAERAPLAVGTAAPSARALRSLRRLLRKGRQLSAG